MKSKNKSGEKKTNKSALAKSNEKVLQKTSQACGSLKQTRSITKAPKKVQTNLKKVKEKNFLV